MLENCVPACPVSFEDLQSRFAVASNVELRIREVTPANGRDRLALKNAAGKLVGGLDRSRDPVTVEEATTGREVDLIPEVSLGCCECDGVN